MGSDTATCNGSHLAKNSATLSYVAGTGTGTADLHAGSLRAKSTTQALYDSQNQLHAGGSASATLYDTLTVEGTWSGSIPIEIRMNVEGSFLTSDANPNTQSTEVTSKLVGIPEAAGSFATSGLRIVQGNSGGVFLYSSSQTGSGQVTTNADPNTTLFDASDVQFVFSIIFNATTSDRTFSFLADLNTSAFLGFTDPDPMVKQGVVDFGNTAQLSVIAPEGVTWSSASGAFLVPVPEPASAGLLGAGLCAFGWLGARRRRR